MKVARWSDLNDRFELDPYAHSRFREDARFRKLDDIEGLLCFSRDWTNGMLWSHYAEKHAGIALGFDVNTSQLPATSVTYRKKRLVGAFDPKMARLTKARDWQYEKEVRAFVRLADMQEEGSLYFARFSDALRLREVILGPECTQSIADARKLVAAVNPEVVVIKACRANNFFKVVPDDTTVPKWTGPTPP